LANSAQPAKNVKPTGIFGTVDLLSKRAITMCPAHRVLSSLFERHPACLPAIIACPFCPPVKSMICTDSRDLPLPTVTPVATVLGVALVVTANRIFRPVVT
jgi:hypothetical protein